ncbi:hypothetical protein GCM10027063_51860 [Promicromonospora xylanilytica]
MAGTSAAANAVAEAQERDLRRAAYIEYFDALDTYATAAAARWESCVPGTDKRLAPDSPCQPTLGEYRTARDTLNDQKPRMELVASVEAGLLAHAIEPTLPMNFGLAGDVVDNEPESARFTVLYYALLEVAACDTSPNPRSNCSDSRSEAVEVATDGVWVRELEDGEAETWKEQLNRLEGTGSEPTDGLHAP